MLLVFCQLIFALPCQPTHKSAEVPTKKTKKRGLTSRQHQNGEELESEKKAERVKKI
jgi:hypothetical protein